MRANFKTFVVAAGAAALAVCTAAMAHHSAAQFDFAQRVTIEGIVKEFNVTNPHTWATVELTDDKRGTRDAQYEGHSASHFYRAGYTRDMVKVGDKIAILIAPRRDGEDGGFIQAFTVNGKTVGFGGLSPETGRRAEGASN
jgi:ABC-type glycerol-3-phosphate transport system substrate-binding protein